MNKEEFKELIKKDRGVAFYLAPAIDAITHILVTKNICTIDELNKTTEKYQDEMLEEAFNKADKEKMKTLKSFNDLFGGLF